ncbi:S-adenosyl-l-methionine hydroxide adenosyltransferase family protein [Bacteroidota bacterium]
MALITFMSDFGTSDHYVAAVKARILSINPGLKIVDISHNINQFDIGHGAYVLKSVFHDFPEGTIHLAAVDSQGIGKNKNIVLKIEDHFFVGADNGLFSMLSEKDPSIIAELHHSEEECPNFPAREVLAKAAAMLASGSNVQDVGNFTSEYNRLLSRQVKATKKQISGNVIRVDHYGNLITNIEEEVFNILKKNRGYTVSFGREVMDRISTAYCDVEAGDCFISFNSLGYLEIGINKGNASELLGLSIDSPVQIFFSE